MNFDLQKITNSESKRFLVTLLRNRKINMEFYKRVPKNKLDFRMVDTNERKSDSPRESIVHQIYVTKNYIYSVKVGKQEWSDERYNILIGSEVTSYSKEQLLSKLEETESELFEILIDPSLSDKTVKVKWKDDPIPAITSLWGLDSHEVFHQGWNLAIMDHLGIERFPEFEEMWG